MDIEQRISNIKKILPYCSHWSNDVVIYDDEVTEFFSEFFNNDERFEKSLLEKIHIQIEEMNTGYRTIPEDYQEIIISYCYDYNISTGGGDWITYHFDEPIIYKDPSEEPRVKIKFDEIPDNIWKIIQNELYKNAAKNIEKELISARKSLDSWEKKKSEFNNLEL